jgi:hypothetical protein
LAACLNKTAFLERREEMKKIVKVKHNIKEKEES